MPDVPTIRGLEGPPAIFPHLPVCFPATGPPTMGGCPDEQRFHLPLGGCPERR